jgi:uncharacterized protein (TIGR03032 family)
MDADVQLQWSKNFESWLSIKKCSLVATTYKTNLIFCFGLWQDKLQIAYSQYAHPGELRYWNGNIYLIANVGITTLIHIDKNNKYGTAGMKFDGNFIPRSMSFVGDIGIHDIHVNKQGDIYFVSSLTNSICQLTVDPHSTHNFSIVWTPHFISRFAIEDRCHLNSFCLMNGEPVYATCIKMSNVVDAWRQDMIDSGVIIDVRTNEVVCSNLTCPHSVAYYNDRLYVLDSGTGRFGWVDFDRPIDERFTELSFIPGYLRSLKFIDDYAVVGVSTDRFDKHFAHLPLGAKLTELKIAPECGMYIIDIRTGDVVHKMTLNNIREIAGVEIIPNVETCRIGEMNVKVLSDTYAVHK